MRTIVVLQSPDLLPLLLGYFEKIKEEIVVLSNKRLDTCKNQNNMKMLINKNITDKDVYSRVRINKEDKIILHCNTTGELKKAVGSILAVCKDIPVLALVHKNEKVPGFDNTPNVSVLLIEQLLAEKISSQWCQIEDCKKISRLQDLTHKAEKILILTQHNPDPDALASGLALRTLLGRNRLTAPIGSFTPVTRDENLTMMRLLDIQPIKVNLEDLQQFSIIAMVDVQPAYFGNQKIRANIIIDHHQNTENYDAPFCDIRTHYGATSTILAEYLFSGGYKITQRLATALLYGIKTDTLFLGRDINPADIDAFTHIYPLANHNMIRQMEHPSLNPDEIHLFIKALRYQRLINKVLFVHLGRVTREDIIPRLADFCLQIAGAEWSAISGVYKGNIILCVRNVGYVKNAGELVKEAFENFGNAGGHRSMARAVIPLAALKKHLNIKKNKEIDNYIATLFLNALNT